MGNVPNNLYDEIEKVCINNNINILRPITRVNIEEANQDQGRGQVQEYNRRKFFLFLTSMGQQSLSREPHSDSGVISYVILKDFSSVVKSAISLSL